MASKKYIVRAGYSYRQKDAQGKETIFHEGDIVDLPEEEGGVLHQLEPVNLKARAKAAAAEEAAAEAARKQAEIDAAIAAETERQAAAAKAEADRIAADFLKQNEGNQQ